MDNNDSYFLDPETRKKIISSSNQSTSIPCDTVSESHYFEAICSLPFPIHKNIRVSMGITEFLDLLMQDTHKLRNQFNQTEQCTHQINEYKREIREATSQIMLLEKNIRKWKKAIRNEESKLKDLRKGRDNKDRSGPGRPFRTENPDTPIINKLISRWIEGLKTELEVKSYVGLAKMIFGSSRGTWENWSKGKRIPTAETMYKYLSMKIMTGKHKGKKLFFIPISEAPTNFDIFNLTCRDLVFEDGIINFDGKIQS